VHFGRHVLSGAALASDSADVCLPAHREPKVEELDARVLGGDLGVLELNVEVHAADRVQMRDGGHEPRHHSLSICLCRPLRCAVVILIIHEPVEELGPVDALEDQDSTFENVHRRRDSAALPAEAAREAHVWNERLRDPLHWHLGGGN